MFQLSSCHSCHTCCHTSCHCILLHSVPLRVSEEDDDDNGDDGDDDDDCFLLRVSEDRLHDDDGDDDDDEDEEDDEDVSEDRLHDEAPRVPGEALALVLPAPALGQSLRRDAPGRVSILLPPMCPGGK